MKKKVEDPEIADISNEIKRLKDNIEACKSKIIRDNLTVQRNRILSKIHQKVQKKDTEKMRAVHLKTKSVYVLCHDTFSNLRIFFNSF